MVGPTRFGLLVEGWEENGHGPLARRLAQLVRSRIGSGLLPAGTFLPPERAIASVLGVSRATVVGALDELRAEGLLTSRQGRGTWVTASGTDDGPDDTTARRLLLGSNHINLAASVPSDASHLPPLALDGADLTAIAPAHGYAPAGLPALRDAIAARHATHGDDITADEVHVTNGAQHALHLALGAVTRRGDVVAIEDPTYVGVFDLLEARRTPTAAPPPRRRRRRDGGDGQTRTRGRSRAIVLVPAVHSPTGRVRRRSDMVRLADRLDRLNLPVIEDNTVADLTFRGSRPPSLATLCERAPVIAVESMSKVAWGGLRVGWLRASSAVVEATVQERERTDFGTSVPAEVLAGQLLGQYDDVIDRRRAQLSERARFFVRLLRRRLSEWQVEAPAGGLSVWVDTGVDASTVARLARQHGVTVAIGASASRHATARTHLRVCFDRPLLELEAAVERLTHACGQMQRGR